MNTLSVKKLQDLLSKNSHQITELFIVRSQIHYALVFCAQYRTFFMIDLRALPLFYETATSTETDDARAAFPTTEIRPSSVPEMDPSMFDTLFAPVFESLYGGTSSSVPPPNLHLQSNINTILFQKRRLCILPIFSQAYCHLVFFSNTYILHDNTAFQVEQVKYNQNFCVYCVSIDDYYVYQNTISQDLFKKYDELFRLIIRNVSKQCLSLSNIFTNKDSIKSLMARTKAVFASYRVRNHQALSIYHRVYSRPHLHPLLFSVMDILFLVFRLQSEYLLRTENRFYTMTFHTAMVLQEIQSDHEA